MAARKKKTKAAKKAPAKKKASKVVEHRKCGVCKKRGHNKRSHEPGGRLYR